MFELFEWFPGMSDRINDSEFREYYYDFLVESGICGTVFLWAMIITFTTLIVFYLVGCNLSHRVANTFVWLGVLAATCLSVFTTTYTLVQGTDDENDPRGVYLSALDSDTGTLSRLKQDSENITSEQIDLISDTCNRYLAQFDNKEETLPIEMAIICTLYSFIVFVVLSFILRRFTIHGKGVPNLPFI